jgi:hypothetical protein
MIKNRYALFATLLSVTIALVSIGRNSTSLALEETAPMCDDGQHVGFAGPVTVTVQGGIGTCYRALQNAAAATGADCAAFGGDWWEGSSMSGKGNGDGTTTCSVPAQCCVDNS